jgi:hypothetical protein
VAFLPDLADYDYLPTFWRPGTKAVGWLAAGHDFPTASPAKDTLDLLWLYCSISVARTRGGHFCDLCPEVCTPHIERRNDKRLLLGTAEIRAFADDGRIYAAPNLIYHYIAVHQYKPPDEFLWALRHGPKPPSREFCSRLEELNLESAATSAGGRTFRFVRRPGGEVEKEMVENAEGDE